MLTEEELKQFTRQITLLGKENQKKLKTSSVLIIGAGGLGCACLQYLSAAGIGRLGLVDHDTVDLTNLHRQVLYNHQDIGKLKVNAAQEKINIDIYPQHFTPDLISSYDIIVDATDDFATKYQINDACVEKNLPFVTASLDRYKGQLALFHHTPNYRHLFPTPPLGAPTCATSGVIGTLPGILGTMQANEVIKYLTGSPHTLLGKLLTFDALTYTTKIYTIHYDPNEQPIIKDEEVTLDDFLDFHLIDIREQDERDEYNIGGTHIPLAQLPTTPLPKDKPVILYCRSGRRSLYAVQMLRETHGYENVYSLIHGIG